jgi:hypothetical protein
LKQKTALDSGAVFFIFRSDFKVKSLWQSYYFALKQKKSYSPWGKGVGFYNSFSPALNREII